jgi:hypothetical protein
VGSSRFCVVLVLGNKYIYPAFITFDVFTEKPGVIAEELNVCKCRNVAATPDAHLAFLFIVVHIEVESVVLSDVLNTQISISMFVLPPIISPF